MELKQSLSAATSRTDVRVTLIQNGEPMAWQTTGLKPVAVTQPVTGVPRKDNHTVITCFSTFDFISIRDHAIEYVCFIFPAPLFIGTPQQHMFVSDRKAGFSEIP